MISRGNGAYCNHSNPIPSTHMAPTGWAARVAGTPYFAWRPTNVFFLEKHEFQTEKSAKNKKNLQIWRVKKQQYTRIELQTDGIHLLVIKHANEQIFWVAK
jgi:hypothetical protein